MTLGPCKQRSVSSRLVVISTQFHSLYGTQYPHTANVRVLAVHVVREDDDLEDVRVNRFAGIKSLLLYTLRLGRGEGRTTPRRRRLARKRRRT